ncbi:hypothetical protein GC56T2_1632 [Geobacillus sp. C56-T2]|nr:hypothetical protein GC56T2_1632 [Geobacillus sp. C56-T2]
MNERDALVPLEKPCQSCAVDQAEPVRAKNSFFTGLFGVMEGSAPLGGVISPIETLSGISVAFYTFP